MSDPNTAALRELVIFRMAEQEFCVDIQSVREIRGFSPTTALPHSPDYVVGVINLRGTVLPICDLSMRFGFGKTEPTERSVVIVCHSDDQLFGLLVDAVSDITTVEASRMQPAPEFAPSKATKFTQNVISMDDRLVALVSVNGLIEQELAAAA